MTNWGGKRSGAGRKSGGTNKADRAEEHFNPPSPADEEPLDYMLRLMRDAAVSPDRRDEMARRALPFRHRHGKAAGAPATPPGKKEAAENASATAGLGTEWGADLESWKKPN
jgi:hypothetical protein